MCEQGYGTAVKEEMQGNEVAARLIHADFLHGSVRPYHLVGALQTPGREQQPHRRIKVY